MEPVSVCALSALWTMVTTHDALICSPACTPQEGRRGLWKSFSPRKLVVAILLDRTRASKTTARSYNVWCTIKHRESRPTAPARQARP